MMFISRRKLAEIEEQLKYERDARWKMERDYWALRAEIDLLASKVGYKRVNVTAKTEYQPIDLAMLKEPKK